MKEPPKEVSLDPADWSAMRALAHRAVDDDVIPRASWAWHRLREGARVEVLTAVQGG